MQVGEGSLGWQQTFERRARSPPPEPLPPSAPSAPPAAGEIRAASRRARSARVSRRRGGGARLGYRRSLRRRRWRTLYLSVMIIYYFTAFFVIGLDYFTLQPRSSTLYKVVNCSWTSPTGQGARMAHATAPPTHLVVKSLFRRGPEF